MIGYYILLSVIIIIAFYQDIKYGKIPNYLTYSAMLIGLVYNLIINGFDGVVFSIIGGIIGFGVFILLYLIGAVGAGDVKLFSAIGFLMGIEFVLYTGMYSIFYAGIIGALIIVVRKKFFSVFNNIFRYLINLVLFRKAENIKEFKSRDSITFPFMYAVLPGVITTCYFIWYM